MAAFHTVSDLNGQGGKKGLYIQECQTTPPPPSLSRLALPTQRDAGMEGWTERITERCLIQ